MNEIALTLLLPLLPIPPSLLGSLCGRFNFCHHLCGFLLTQHWESTPAISIFFIPAFSSLHYKPWNHFYFAFTWPISKEVLWPQSLLVKVHLSKCSLKNLSSYLYDYLGKDPLFYQLPHFVLHILHNIDKFWIFSGTD